MSLKKKKKKSDIVSAAWEIINFASKCTDMVNLFLHSSSASQV